VANRIASEPEPGRLRSPARDTTRCRDAAAPTACADAQAIAAAVGSS